MYILEITLFLYTASGTRNPDDGYPPGIRRISAVSGLRVPEVYTHRMINLGMEETATYSGYHMRDIYRYTRSRVSDPV